MPPSYELTRDADADLTSIVQYTLETWGDQQTEIYVRKLEACFCKLGTPHVVQRRLSKAYEDLYVTPCGHHFIFYMLEVRDKPLVIAILHERMDLIRHIVSRLKGHT